MQPHSTRPAVPEQDSEASVIPFPTGEPPLQLEAFLPYRFNVLSALVLRALGQIFGERYGIAIPEWRVIATIGQFGTLTAKQIGAHSHMHKTKVSRAVATLERRNLIIRRSNKADLREAFLSLTEDGLAIYRDIAPTALEFGDRMVADLDPTDYAVLDRVLDKLTARAAALASEATSGPDDDLD
ncbi:MarR family winged helix-turn-helix transcriptional regulator [Blastochloris viridis]|uniref:Multidrug resistance operon repressor n=1 Tax=Blastochloris viridis TaxID=1079 RepID=A0A0H5BAN0_BLAVI|nr:MarR family winged helix-turn-helix transcriptional regulator [Blastochloris viridis]ALK08588.1 Multidrug resistance operon repressor [Blastochloris viridis]BAR98124.1 transcriptional regulator [Blastochloris viridis]CUU41251.1 Multidrug resistance operon repressor [Blastochloris viridis]